MLFSDPVYFVFLAGYFAAHIVTPPKYRLYLLIVGSTIFYGWWKPAYVWVPYLLSLIAWLGVCWIAGTKNPLAQKRRLVITLVVLFAPLALFKYTHFFLFDVIGQITGITRNLSESEFQFALPLGISFVTFTLTALVVNVYRGEYPPERRPAVILGYVLFFPHLIAGPILRPHELIPQLLRASRALDARFLLGAAIFVLGLSKKLIFADAIAPEVGRAFVPGAQLTSLEYLLAMYGFAMQIYCDFSGYTDMAIGTAYLLRIRLPRNFRSPYASGSIVEFWRRWHITLSFWLRDYLYIPLGGNRFGFARQLLNLMVTMLLGGLWHGANWTFVLWGALHGIALSANHVVSRFLPGFRLPGWLKLLITFHFVTFAWVYFRAPSLSVAHDVLAGPFTSPTGEFASFFSEHVYTLCLLAVFYATHRFDGHARVRLALRHLPKPIVWAVLIMMAVLAVALNQGNSAKFIYFDF